MPGVPGRDQLAAYSVSTSRALSQAKASASRSPPAGRFHSGSNAAMTCSVSHNSRCPPGRCTSTCGADSAPSGMSRPSHR
ncbi:hypothetical protein SCALM49S_03159 [Streptomyces californicus]